MKKAFIVFIILLLVLSLSALIAETGKKTATAKDAELKEYQYDAKGGIIVPNAHQGFKQKQLTAEQTEKLNQLKKNMSKDSDAPARPIERDYSASKKKSSQ
jgi:hypothetical protein